MTYLDTAMVPLKPRSEELVEQSVSVLWQLRKRGLTSAAAAAEELSILSPGALEETLSRGLVRLEDGRVAFTPAGEGLARDVTRRHLLAERLLADVLDIRGAALASNACQWEHILSPDVARSICTLLGHPRTCPHGEAIPSGECCAAGHADLAPLLTPLRRLPLGVHGQIAYLSLQDASLLHRLLSLGFSPGTTVRLREVSPACVVQVGETLVALDEELADAVTVRRAHP